ncbi:expressed unknown protein [Seminavis robusta]|uniref:Uncharacterized protein n=1 Tax=Seminavis robusta TaxID=568900 RepID=A0A9N8HKP2_9STRA|nr:expressed unknown protein [Seminavis robusta]|eukprot:Sro961_g224980.1 n/a (408) ;mRNA; r:19365-20773
MATETLWTIGQEVNVTPRTWPGINKPGGHGKIVKIHYSSLGVVDGLDVKYTLNNSTDKNLEADLVTPHVELDRGRRSRRSREFLTMEQPSVKKRCVSKRNQPTPVAYDEDSSEDENEDSSECEDENEDSSEDEKENKCCGDSKSNSIKARADANKSRRNEIFTKNVAGKQSDRDPLKQKYSNNRREIAAAPQTTKKPFRKSSPVALASPAKKCKPPSIEVPRLVVTNAIQLGVSVSPLAGGASNDNRRQTSSHAAVSNDEISTHVSRCPKQAKTNHASIPNLGGAKLKRSYDRDIQEGSIFLNDIVASKPTTVAAKKPAPPPPVRVVKTESERLQEERFQLFSKLFNDISHRNDDSIPANELTAMINSSGKSSSVFKPFSHEEAQSFVDELCRQDKAMQSEGTYFAC